MADAEGFGERLERVLKGVEVDAAREGITLACRAQVYQGGAGLRAIVTMTAGEKTEICPECDKPVTAPRGEWRNDPRQTGTRYVCPKCHQRLQEGSGRG
jgi:hypothetical protein